MNTLKFFRSNVALSQVSRFFKSQGKIFSSSEEAVADLKDGQSVLVGGFGVCGVAESLINAIKAKGIKNLTAYSCTAGLLDSGVGTLITNKQVKKLYSSYIGENAPCEKQFLSGELEVELTPQGTLAEKFRSGGAGIPAFYTPTGVGTMVEEGGMPIKYKADGSGPCLVSLPKERRTFNGRDYIMEETVFADVALIKAWKADSMGNLVFRRAARNFNMDMATAARLVIAEVDEIVEVGELDCDQVHVSSVFVDRIVKTSITNKRIERIMTQEIDQKDQEQPDYKLRAKIARRAAKEMKNGMYVNLGIGIPTLLPKFLGNTKITIVAENGIVGQGTFPADKSGIDPEVINASKQTVTMEKGCAIVQSSTAFGMFRGGHIDATVLGSMQVSKEGDMANWMVPGKLVKGMGGAMDLVASGSRVIVCMEHTVKGKPKIFDYCSLPLTGKGVVDTLVTELAVFKKIDGELTLTDIAKDTTLENVRALTAFKFKQLDTLGTWE